MPLINLKYLPKKLSSKDKKKQLKMLLDSQKDYKNKKYTVRAKLKSYSSKKSKHVLKAEKMYNVSKIDAKGLAKPTGCSVKALNKIINKGIGAYYSSGSRPNQTGQSWGVARLASAVTSGKSAIVDYSILKEGCSKNSKALMLAEKAKKKKYNKVRKILF